MGSPKPLLAWGGEPLVTYQVRQLQAAGADIVVVVLGHAAEQVRAAVPAAGVRTVVNARYREGRASSVRAGAAAIDDGAEAVIVLNVDQPRPAALSRQLLLAHRGADYLITVPEYGGRRRHPVVLSGTLVPQLRQVEEATLGLRALLQRYAAQTQRVRIEDPLLELDLNTPEAYIQAHRLVFGRPPA